MSRLYVVESSPSGTGTLADHRLTASSHQITALTAALAAELGVQGAASAGDLDARDREWVLAVVEDLAAKGDRALVICGEYAAPEVHTLAHAMNVALGCVGQTVDYIEPIEHRWEIEGDSLRSLVRDMEAGQVDLLLILGCNPVFDAPADLQFMQAMDNVTRRVHLGLYEDETAEFCHWHLPEAHFLESWGDARAYDGTVCMTQPLIEPLYGGRTVAEVVSAFTSKGPRPALELVQSHWRNQVGAADFDTAWRSWLHDGFKPLSDPSTVAVSVDSQAVTAACTEIAAATGTVK